STRDWSSDVCSSDLLVDLGVTPKYGGPEYETLAASGSLCGVKDLNALALINQLHAQYVLDSISTGAVCAFAMECYEHGIITSEKIGRASCRGRVGW